MLKSDFSRTWKLSATAVMCALVQAGCGAPVPPAPAPSLPAIGAGEATIGAGETHATYGFWGDGKAVLVWSAIPDADFGSGTTDSGAEYHGLHLAEDGRRIEWTCTTDDGTTGSVTINGNSYDLSAGRVFLVRVEGGETTVVQRDTSQLADSNLIRTLVDWLANDEDVRAFFGVKETPEKLRELLREAREQAGG